MHDPDGRHHKRVGVTSVMVAVVLMVGWLVPGAAGLLIFPRHDVAVRRTCLTSSGTAGQCVSAVRLECSLYPTVSHLLRRRPRICAFSATDALVCCPLHAVQFDQDRRLTQATRPTPRPTRPTLQPTRLTPRPTRLTPRPTRLTPRPTRPTPRTTRPTPRPTRPTTRPTRPTPQPTTSRTTQIATTRPPTVATSAATDPTMVPGVPRLPIGVPRREPSPVFTTPRPRFSGPLRARGCGVSSPFVLFRLQGEYLLRRPRFGRAVPVQVAGQPWTALIGLTEEDGTGRWMCVGALVAPRVVVTVAHCSVLGGAPDRLMVGLGDHDLRSTSDGSGGTFRVLEVQRHPRWTPPSRRHDLALLLLAEPVVPSQLVNHICLPPVDPLPPAPAAEPDFPLFLAAYHMDVHNLETTTGGRGRLQSQRASLEPLSSCASWLASDPLSEFLFPGGPEQHTELCLSATSRCEMDVGAPLISQAPDGLAQLEGLHMLDGCVPRRGQLVLRIRHYVPWILSTSEEMVQRARQSAQSRRLRFGG